MVKPEPQHTEAYKQFHIRHMIDVVQTRMYQKTGQIIQIPIPENEEDKEKLNAMYQKVLDNIGK